GRDRTPATMFLPAVMLLAATAVLGVLPELPAGAEVAAARTQDAATYQALVLDDRAPSTHHSPHSKHTLAGILYGGLSALLAVAVALAAIYRKRLPAMLHAVVRPLHGGLRVLRAAHSGRPTDYVAWLTLGTALLGGAFAGVLR
ncbi:MAG: hypothetical protein ACRDJ5_00320, partial [Actinomycetota bacterium]